jgi:hypothetical protein
MLSSDERMMIGLKVLERLRTGWQDGRYQLRQLLDPQGTRGSTGNTHPVDPNQEERDWPPSLETLLDQAGDLSLYSVVLGVCEDGLPFLLDLTNPAPGAILICSDHGGGKTRLLRALLASASYLNPPDQLVFYLAARQPDEYSTLESLDHCKAINSIDQGIIPSLLDELASIAETRRRGRPEPPFIIFAIDGLVSYLDILTQEQFERLYWLIRHGPRSFIWPIITLSAEDSLEVHPRLLSLFRTRLIGFIHNDSQAGFLSGDERLDARWIEEGLQFYVPYGDEWLPFWVCDPFYEEGHDTEEFEDPVSSKASITPHESQALKELKVWNERLGSEYGDQAPGDDMNTEESARISLEKPQSAENRPELFSVPPRQRPKKPAPIGLPYDSATDAPPSEGWRQKESRNRQTQKRIEAGSEYETRWPARPVKRAPSERRNISSRPAETGSQSQAADGRGNESTNGLVPDERRRNGRRRPIYPPEPAGRGRPELDELRSHSSIPGQEIFEADDELLDEELTEGNDEEIDDEIGKDFEPDAEFSDGEADEYEYINDYQGSTAQGEEDFLNGNGGNDGRDEISDEI